MKVKVLSSNLIGADYKPLPFGAEIEVKNAELAELWIKAKLVEEVKEVPKKGKE